MNALRLLVARLFLLLVVGLVLSAGVVVAVAGASSGGAHPFSQPLPSARVRLAGRPLVVESAQEMLGGEQMLAQRRADLANPIAVDERRASRTRFERLGTAGAVRVAREAFPGIVEHPAGGAPKLPAGDRILEYEARNAAAVALPSGGHGVVESPEPIATPGGHGRFSPINLELHSTASGYVPANSDVAVRIARHVAGGVSMPGGVSLTPVNAKGQPLDGSEGVQEGASVVYANTQADTDTLVKPTAGGFEIDSLLRSVESPRTLYFRVGMPAGARLVGDRGPGGARVLLAGRTIAGIALPGAEDAESTAVPVEMSVLGDTLAVVVEGGAGEYRYPIEVDPNVYDTSLETYGITSNWKFEAYKTSKFEAYPGSESVVLRDFGGYYEKEYDELYYGARGESSVMYIEEESRAGVSPESGAMTQIQFATGYNPDEESLVLGNSGESYSRSIGRLCLPVTGTCGEGSIPTGNLVRLIQMAYRNGGEPNYFFMEIYKTDAGVRQEKGPSASFNTSQPTIAAAGGLQNVLYGAGGGLSESNGAVEVYATDPGLGVSRVSVRDLAAGASWTYTDPVYEEKLCTGIWCSEVFKTEHDSSGAYFTYSKEMVEGANEMELCAEDMAGMLSCADATVDVDNTPPRAIKLTGLAETGAEISAAQHQITVEATDGTAPTLSSGIKSIQVFVDGREIGKPAGSCAPGECTAKGTWTVDGETLGSGEHKLRILATDNAGNGLEKEITFAVRNATPVKVGPGMVDPVTGQLSLSAPDVDIAGAGSVSRTYRSRSLAAGVEGPLGPQWKLSAGSGMSLEIAPDGSAELASASGALTTFAEEAGKFRAPKGDENLTLEAVEKEAGRGVVEYLLKDAKAGTTTTFTLPSGSNIWVPVRVRGAAPDTMVAYSYRSVKVLEANVTEPIEELGPVPAGVSCGKNPTQASQVELQKALEELRPGCRALSFTYADKTTATGEGPSEWGEYNGRLIKVSLTAYNPAASSKKMETTAVAQYAYDKQGRLRAEWDPRIEQSSGCGGTCSALKATYGYDAGGHVTAVAVPGQQPWLFTYGANGEDTSLGRLIAVSRPGKETGLHSVLPSNTAQPALSSTTPAIGFQLKVSQGTWSNSPTIYGYQWYDCNGTVCTPIPGANNPTYRPVTSDGGYALAAEVTATNGAGSVSVRTATSQAIPARAAASYTAGGHTLETSLNVSFSSSRMTVTVASVSFTCTHATGNGSLESGGAGAVLLKFEQCTGPPECSLASMVVGVTMRVAYGLELEASETPTLPVVFTVSAGNGDATIEGASCAKKGTYQIYGEIVGTVTQEREELSKHAINVKTSKLGYQLNGMNYPAPELKDSGSGRPDFWEGTWNVSAGGTAYAEQAGTRYASTSETPTPPKPGSTAVTTIEYRVPLSGGSAPHQMTSTELAKWGQKNDLPDDATAIFPPDEPQGWPATVYKRATLLYMDEHARTTNTATPSGAISTVEYNSLNEVTRQLTAGDRAIAIEEGCESETKCKSAEVAKNLSTEKIYNSEGTELLETLGPEHKIKLPDGTEEETRDRQKFTYNEGAKEVEEKTKETYNLVTKSTSWVEGAAKQKLDQHESTTTYSNAVQGELGWKLRKPLATSETLAGKTTTTSTAYNSETGQALEAFTSTTTASPVYALRVGSVGTGAYQFQEPLGDAVDGKGNIWVVDSVNDRIEELSPTGVYLNQVVGTGENALKGPRCVAIDSNGNLWVTDTNDNRVEEFASSGTFLRKFGSFGTGNGQFKTARGIAIDAKGDVWVVDSLNNRVEEFSATGEYMSQFGTSGVGNGEFKEPYGIAIDGAGNIWVTDYGNNRLQEFSSKGNYLSQFGETGKGSGQLEGPWAMAIDHEGHLWVSDVNNDRIQEFSPQGEYLTKAGTFGSGAGQFNQVRGVAIGASGNVWAVDAHNDNVEQWQVAQQAPLYTSAFGAKGTGVGQMEGPEAEAIDSKGDVWVADVHNHRVDEFSPTGSFLLAVGWGVKDGKAEAETCTTSCQIGIGGSGNGQLEAPWGVAISSSTGNVYVSDVGANNRVEEFSSSGTFVATIGSSGTGTGQFTRPEGLGFGPGGNLWVTDSGNNRIEEFSPTGSFMVTVGWGVKDGKAEAETCTSSCQVGIVGAGAGQMNLPNGIAFSDANLFVSEYNNNRVQDFSLSGAYISKLGSEGHGNGQLLGPFDIAADPNTADLYVVDSLNYRIEEFTPSGAYLSKFGTDGTGNGQFSPPQGVAVDQSGNIYVSDHNNNRIEKWTSAPRPGNEAAKDTQTIYYSEAANAEYPSCGSHPEWANLVCQTEPDVQPGDSGPPPLPVTTITYNMWDEPETVVEKIGSVTRTTKKTYDSAGRETANEETSTSSEDAGLPAVTDEYSAETGKMVKESETLEGAGKTITSVYNTLGQMTSYTDAEGATTKYTYDIDGRVEEVREPQGSQIYAYDPTTGFLTKLWDSSAETFTATYGVSGEMLTEGYPNGIVGKYTYNTIGQATMLEYEKTTHCTENCVWFSDAQAFGAEGQTLSQTSSLSSETYSYNEEGLLTQTQETPVGGKGCVTRVYGYDEEGERTSLTTREPNEKGECTSEGGLVEEHAYDAVGRLLDPGVTYDALGNMTKVPAADAGGQAITSGFYVDNQVANQEQAGKAIAYTYDPAGRTLLAKQGKTLSFSHYAGPGEALTWKCEEEEGKKECQEQKATQWTRNIPGIDGALDAIQSSGSAPVLQLHDLQGNIVATVEDSETATRLQSTDNSTEFGVPSGGKTPKYAWLGASGAESELETGVITTAGSTYVPQLARTAQTEVTIPPGAAPNGTMDKEAYTPPEIPWAAQSGREAANDMMAEQRALEMEAEEAQCTADPASCPEDLVSEDPDYNYRAWEANGYAEELETAIQKGNIVGALSKIYNWSWGIIAQIESLFGETTIEHWAKELAKDLRTCTSDLHETHHSHGGCRVAIFDYTIFGIDTGIYDFSHIPIVSECLGMSSDRKHVHWCTNIEKKEILEA